MVALLPRRAVETAADDLQPGARTGANGRRQRCGARPRVGRSALVILPPPPTGFRSWPPPPSNCGARNQELETALALAVARTAQNDSTNNLPEPLPLVLTEAIRARVLGRRACAVLPDADILATGTAHGIRRDALALLDSTVTIDAGTDAQLVAGDLALAGRRIFGKVIEAGPHTCVVRRADQTSYRDVVQLVKLVDGRPRFGATGMLEGAGQRAGPCPAGQRQ